MKLLALAGATIARLFGVCSPVAIAGFIVAVVVYAVNGVFCGRLAAHIGKEVFKRVKPTVAYSNAASAIVWVLVALGIAASFAHGSPRVIFWAVALAMLIVAARSCFFSKAPATLRQAAMQASAQNDKFVAAITSTQPSGVSILVNMREVNNRQAPVALACSIYEFFGSGDRLLRSHIVTSVTILVRAASGVSSTRRCSRFNPHYTLVWGTP